MFKKKFKLSNQEFDRHGVQKYSSDDIIKISEGLLNNNNNRILKDNIVVGSIVDYTLHQSRDLLPIYSFNKLEHYQAIRNSLCIELQINTVLIFDYIGCCIEYDYKLNALKIM